MIMKLSWLQHLFDKSWICAGGLSIKLQEVRSGLQGEKTTSFCTDVKAVSSCCKAAVWFYVGLSVHHFGPDRDILTCGTDFHDAKRMNPNNLILWLFL